MNTLSTLPQDLWNRIPPEAQPYIEMLKGQVQTLTSMVHILQEQVRTLQEQLNQTSRNSSCPPSSDPPQSPRPRRPRGQRRRGGQPGHPGHTRLLLPVEAVDEVVVLKPAQCTHCQAPLSGDDGSVTNHGADTYPSRQGRIKLVEGHYAGCAALHPNLLNINVVCAMCPSGCLPCYDPTGMSTFPLQSQSTCICYASYESGPCRWQDHAGDGLWHHGSLLERARTLVVSRPAASVDTPQATWASLAHDETPHGAVVWRPRLAVELPDCQPATNILPSNKRRN